MLASKALAASHPKSKCEHWQKTIRHWKILLSSNRERQTVPLEARNLHMTWIILGASISWSSIRSLVFLFQEKASGLCPSVNHFPSNVMCPDPPRVAFLFSRRPCSEQSVKTWECLARKRSGSSRVRRGLPWCHSPCRARLLQFCSYAAGM